MTKSELRKLAKAATPGPWYWVAQRHLFGKASHPNAIMSTAAQPSESNKAYIAAMHPQQTLALLDEIERLRSVLQKIETMRSPHEVFKGSDLAAAALTESQEDG